jgi:WD40 repeat protein
VEDSPVTPERYARVCELFARAEPLPPSRRQQFLQQACGADADLQAEVEKMLAHATPAGADSFPTSPFSLNLKALLPPPPGPDSLAGRRIGPYQIRRLLGSGGMGSVYLAARVDDFQHEVALKLIKPGHDTGELVRRFRTERQVLAGLNHPHIARLLDGGTTAEGQPYFVMEYIDGLPIDRYCDDHQLPTRERVRLLRAVCGAVHFAHGHGVIHRDLKPGNVLLAADGTPRVVDFGLAKRLDAAAAGADPTRTGVILGTPSYIAPEQASGTGKNVGPAADVYALGAILYELLTGRPPFRADTPLDTLLQVLNEEPLPPSRLHPKLARDLETICLKCLQKDPARRYPSAEALGDDLKRFLDGAPIRARPVGRIERAWRWCRRYPVVASLTALVAVLLVAVAVGATLMARREKQLRTTAEAANEQLEVSLYAQRVAVAERELSLRQDVGRAEELLDQCPERLRGWEWHYLRRLLDGGRPDLRGHKSGVWSVAFRPDGRRLISGSIDGTVKVWDAATGRLVRTLDPVPGWMRALSKSAFFPVMSVAYSPDGRRIAAGGLSVTLKGVVYVWDADKGTKVFTYLGHPNLVCGLAFHPQGRLLASAGYDNTVHLWDAASGKRKHILKGHTDWINRPAFSPDGRLLASPSMDGTVKIWETRTGREVASLADHEAPVRDAEFSRDGRQLATAGLDGTAKVWDTADWHVRVTLGLHSGGALGVGFHPRGKRLASVGFDKTVKVWDLETGREAITLRGHTDTVCGVAFSPDGWRLASAGLDKRVKLWDATPRRGPDAPSVRFLRGHTERVNRVVFSPDGRRLATASWDKTARVWDAKTLKQLLTLRGHTLTVWGVAFSRDGRRLATASWDRTVKVWDAATGRELRTLRGHRSGVHCVAFRPDGKHLASSCHDGTVKIWETRTGKTVRTLRPHTFLAYSVAYSPDGKYLATGGGDRRVTLWDAKTYRPLNTFKDHTAVVHAVAFSPNSRLLASASWDMTVKVWDVRSRRRVANLQGHRDRVHGLAFSPDGTRLASAGEDKTVRLWKIATGRQSRAPWIHRGVVWSVAFHPTGRRLASAGWYVKGGVRLWQLGP